MKANDSDVRRATRIVDDTPALAFACYEGGMAGDEWTGQHVGVVHSVEEAEAWLRGEPVKLMRVWPQEQKVTKPEPKASSKRHDPKQQVTPKP